MEIKKGWMTLWAILTIFLAYSYITNTPETESLIKGPMLTEIECEALGYIQGEEVDLNLKEVLETPKEECSRVGGEWKMLPDGCVDSCEKARGEEIACSAAPKESCECGPNSCWNGKTCEPN